MKLNISYPVTGCQKVIEVEDEKKLRAFYEKKMSHEVNGDVLGDEFKGYVFRISGGNDQQGFPMKQGVLTSGRVRLLFDKDQSCYRPRRKGERKRKSVRGCIVGADLAVLNLVVVKKGDNDVEGLTDKVTPRRLGPKRANHIRKLFNLEKQDDVRQYVIKRQIVRNEKKPYTKAPKIQRLITPDRIQRKKNEKRVKQRRIAKAKAEATVYNDLIAARQKEIAKKKAELHARRRSRSQRQSTTK